MAQAADPSQLLQTLRQGFLPFLHRCSVPEDLPAVLRELAGSLAADGAVLWRAEGDALVAQASFGSVSRGWIAAHADDTAAVRACREGSSVLAEASRGPYAPAACGLQLALVAGIPILGPKGCAGSVELWWSDSGREPVPITEILPELEAMLRQVLPVLLAYETDRHKYVQAISRLMMLYDVGKVFHSTLELNELSGLILARVQNVLETEEVAVWLLDRVRKNLYCAAAGPQRAAFESVRIWAGDAGLGAAAAEGEAKLLQDVDDPAWTDRWGAPVRSLLAVPLMHGGRFLGAIEAVRGADSSYFTEEHLHLLIDIAKQAAVALRNAQRLEAERRVKELQALTEISKEITATLDLDRVLSTAVNRIMTVIPADRCSISLLRRGRWELNAVSGQMKVDHKAPEMQDLEAIHVWLAGTGEDFAVVQTEQGVQSDREDIREKFTRHFGRSQMRVLVGLQLRDEEGALGVMVLESKDPQALSPSHVELAGVFGSQLTVALRNAMLYQQMPLVNVLHPLVVKKAKLEAMPAVRRRAILIGGAAVLAFLIFFPWWSKPSGEVQVLPARIQPVSAEVDGVVRRIFVNEGNRLQAGQLVAELDPNEHQVALVQAQSQYDILGRRVLQLESEGHLGEASIERARWQEAAAELDLRRAQLVQTQIRSPISGVVVTPHLQERVGQYLRRGDVFCQVVDLGRAWAEIAVPESDVGEIQPGAQAWLKLNTYPTRKFVGRVIQVAPQAREKGEDRFFDVIIEVANPDQALRAGMMGRGKILARRASLGYLVLRVPARWIWLKLWKWLP